MKNKGTLSRYRHPLFLDIERLKSINIDMLIMGGNCISD